MKANQFQKVLFLLMFLTISISFSQEINNNFRGYFKAESKSSIYSSFEFDGNGKAKVVGIGLLGISDYFTKGDSLIIYPDKNILKFKIQKNTLVGASSWVEKQTWIKKDTLVPNNRKDEVKAKNTAILMNEYYKIIGDKSSFDFLGDDTKATAKKSKMNQLCNQDLTRACLDYFGMLVIEDQGLINLLNSKKNTKPENSTIIALGKKIINSGEPEGHYVLGGYFIMIGQKQKGIEQLKIGEKKGNLNASMALFSIETAEDLEKIEPVKKPKTVKKRK